MNTQPHTHRHSSACTGDHAECLQHHGRQDVVCLDEVSFRYSFAERWALRNITLHVPQDCTLGIIGPNGAGKTTLIQIILGLLDGYQGSAKIQQMTPRQACRRGDVIGYVPQRHEAEWRFPVTAMQVVTMGLVGKTGMLRRHSRDDLQYAEHVMERVGVADLAQRPVNTLSGGQQQRLFIARALAPQPKALILDEPTVGIDEAGQRRFAQLMQELRSEFGLTILIVSHDIRAIAAGCNRVACLNQTIHYHDSPKGLTSEVLREVFQHEIAGVL